MWFWEISFSIISAESIDPPARYGGNWIRMAFRLTLKDNFPNPITF